MTPSPRERLAGALAALRNTDVPRLAVAAGVTPRQAANAMKARPVEAVAYLRLCAACRLDPLPELTTEIDSPGEFLFSLLAISLRLRRSADKQTERQIAKAINVAPSTVCRIEKGHTMSIGVVLRACTFLGIHPYGFCAVQHKSFTKSSARTLAESNA